MDYRKAVAALVAVAIALVGVFTGMRWLTVVALVLWVVAMLVFGFGDRNRPGRIQESEE
jgi:type IV secretory pathway VirB3-like protein